MAIALDAVAKSIEQTSTTNFTFSHTCTGSDLCLVVAVASSANPATSATYNGVSMTAVAAATTLNGLYIRHFYLVAPATGANTVSITFSSAAGVAYGLSASFTGVDQSSPIDATSTGSTGTSNTGMGDSVTTVANNAMVLGGIARGSGETLTLTTGTAHQQTNGGGTGAQAYILKATAGAQTIDWSATTSSIDWATQNFSLAEVVNDTDVTATTDALVISEQTADIAHDRVVTAGTDALSIAEQTASVALDVNITASTDALVIAEQTATVSLDINITASTDALVLTENAADVSTVSGIQATTDELVLTENTATISLDVNVTASTDSLVISANSASITLVSDVEETSGGGWLPKEELRKLQKIRSDLVKKEQEERNLALQDKREEKRELERIFNRINGIEEVSDELESIVEPFVKEVPDTATELQPQMPQIDFEALATQTKTADKLRQLADRLDQQRLDEDDAIALLLLV